LRNHQLNQAALEQETELHLDDLDVALFLMLKLKDLYDRLEVEKKTVLLRILAKRIMVNPEGEITKIELNAPFTYLKSLADDFLTIILEPIRKMRDGRCCWVVEPPNNTPRNNFRIDT